MNWQNVGLVIFDVDGTLYDQRRLRLRMAAALLRHTIRSRSLLVLRVISVFRRCREGLADNAAVDFIESQYGLTADECGCSREQVRDIVEEWIERRPLQYIGGCIYPGTKQLFDTIIDSGRLIAICSDYPAVEKLAALRLPYHLSVSAVDDDVRQLKPNPAGLAKILRLTGMLPAQSVFIGDRSDRDGEAARRIGMRSLIRSRHAAHWETTFRSYRDKLFFPLFQLQG